MRRAAAAVVLAAGLAAAGAPPAAAQGCGDGAALRAALAERWGEAPRFGGLSANGYLVELWLSEATGTWTVFVMMPGGRACLLASGEAGTVLPAPIPGEEG